MSDDTTNHDDDDNDAATPPPCRVWCTTLDCYAMCGQPATEAHNSYADHRCALHR